MEHSSVHDLKLSFMSSTDAAELAMFGNEALSCNICDSSVYGH